MPRHVALVGFADGWEDAFKSGAEIWALNDIREGLGPGDADLWFQLHSLPYLRKHYSRWVERDMPKWIEFWENGGLTTMFMHEHYPELVGSMAFPTERLMALPYGYYHCSSFDWMVAYALAVGNVSEISLYGISLSPVDGEPMMAHSCLEFWLGRAIGRGIKVYNHCPDLFTNYQLLRSHRRYGWEYDRHIVDAEGCAS